MKVVLFLFTFFCLSFSASAQLVIDRPEPEMEQEEAGLETATFIPHPRLMDRDRWTRVSTYRFECHFLRLAVEFKDHSYVLMEMDGQKRILARSINYNEISQKIIELTLNPRPSLDNYH